MKLVRIPLFAIVAVCFALPASAQNAAKIATVNAARVFNEIMETKDLKVKMENEQKTIQATDLEKKTKIKDLQQARDALKPEAPSYEDANKALVQGAIDYRVWQELTAASIQRQQKQQMLSLFNKITDAVKEVATQKGLDLVIAEQKPELSAEDLEKINTDQLRAVINQRNVIFSNPSVDISTDVIAAMDAKYKAGK